MIWIQNIDQGLKQSNVHEKNVIYPLMIKSYLAFPERKRKNE